MNKRTKALSALASAGILAAGWGVATANGTTLTAADASATTSPTGAATQAGSAGAGSTGASTGTSVNGTFTGAAARHRYGSVQVTATIENGKITNLTEKVASDGDRKSDRINSRAIPVLRSSLIGSNGSGASTVSGATYTTRAYLSSLQSALDQAGVRA